MILQLALFGTLAGLSYAAPTSKPPILSKRTSGRASWYDAGLGACGDWNNAGDFIVALNSVQFHPNGETQWPSSQCNRPIRITHNGKSVDAVVKDECPDWDGNGCHEGYLDMTFGLFQQWYSDPWQQGIFWMEWEFTDGQGGGGSGGYTPPTQPTPSNCAQTYTSASGDNCSSIGQKFGFSATQIHDANTFLNCDNIWANTPICIPKGGNPSTPSGNCASTYTSKAGDTCTSIGASNGFTADQIHSANSFLDCNNIWANTPICIPSGGNPSTPTGNCGKDYTSKAGDTCASIGSKCGLTADQIHAANTFLDCGNIWVNTPITIPQGGSTTPTCSSTYTSKAGDNCGSIESKYGLPAGSIKTANDFLTCNNIWVNTPVCIPPGGTSPA